MNQLKVKNKIMNLFILMNSIIYNTYILIVNYIPNRYFIIVHTAIEMIHLITKLYLLISQVPKDIPILIIKLIMQTSYQKWKCFFH